MSLSLKSGAPADTKVRVPRFQKLVVLVMVWASFGPYVGPLRTEQMAVYGMLLMLIVILPFKFLELRVAGGMKLLVPWIMVLIVALMGVAFPSDLDAIWERGQAIAGLDNLFLPIAVMLVIWSVVKAEYAPELLRSAGRVVVWMAALNGVLAVASTRVDLSPYLKAFWGNAEIEGPSTAYNASTLGRFSGIFNHPAEAGVVYGVAGMLAIYLYRNHSRKLFLALTFIVLGGLISVSKVFILGGLPLIVIYLWRSRTVSGKAGFLVTLALVAAGVSQTGWLQAWSGFSYLSRLLAPAEDQGFIEFYTAGRWNEGSTLTSVIDEVIRLSPFLGVGAGGWKVPYDSGWTEVLVVAGLVGAVLHGIVFLGLLVNAGKTLDPARRRMTYFLAVFLVGADLGIASLTANRVATVVWVVLALLVLARKQEPEAEVLRPRKIKAAKTPLPSPAYRHMLKQRQTERVASPARRPVKLPPAYHRMEAQSRETEHRP